MTLSYRQYATSALITTMMVIVFMMITMLVSFIPFFLVVHVGSAAMGYDLGTGLWASFLLFNGMLGGWALPMAWRACMRDEHRKNDESNAPLLPLGERPVDTAPQDV